MSIELWWNALKKIYIWDWETKWPCHSGFHIPTNVEWTNIITLLTTLWIDTSSSDCMKTYLKMPLAGRRDYYSSDVQVQDVGWYYWTSIGSSAVAAYSVNITYWPSVGSASYTYWYSLRPFKNTPVIPDSTRTALYSDKIYHNSILWLISLSDNGIDWITIADKNLWATTVYNDWDILSEVNCGKYYQRWNNYWFDWTWSVTTSNTQVDASGYWPWNYYSSSTFINWVARWSTDTIYNIWWWVTNNKYLPIKKVTIRPNGTEKQIRPKLNYLCFTANTNSSTIKLAKIWSPTTVYLETSTDGYTWSDYTIWDTITLSSTWDKVYWRNKSNIATNFSTSSSNYYRFTITWSMSWSWDVNYLLCNTSTLTLPNTWCYYRLFENCLLTTPPELPATTLKDRCYQWMFINSKITIPPKLPATTLTTGCYYEMFAYCYDLETLLALYATSLTQYCYTNMFYGCSKIKLSTTQDSTYNMIYIIPAAWTWTQNSSLNNMFYGTWWTFTWTPTINTTYYTSNTLV